MPANFMSDAEVIVQFLRAVEWRLRANRLIQESIRGLSKVLIALMVIKVWDLISPFKATTIRFILAGCALSFVSYVVWRARQKGTLDQAAVSIDQRTDLNDEMKTALWFIRNPRSSKWVDIQIRRAAHNADKIDVRRAYPAIMPRTAYAAAAMILVLLGLNFAPLPLNHNWLTLNAAPGIDPAETAERAAASQTRRTLPRKIRGFQNGSNGGSLNLQSISTGLEEIAASLRRSERLRGVAQALMDKRLDLAAEKLREVGADLAGASPGSFPGMQEILNDSARNPRSELQSLAEHLAATARAMQNKNMTAVQEAIEEVAEDFEGLEEEIYAQESNLDQLARGNERRAEQDGRVSSAPIPDARDFPQATSSSDGFGASGGKAESGPRQGRSTTLAVKLRQEGVEGMEGAGVTREDVRAASRQERSKLDYHDVSSEVSAAPKDVLDHRESTPWKYRPLIKSYFEAILESHSGP